MCYLALKSRFFCARIVCDFIDLILLGIYLVMCKEPIALSVFPRNCTIVRLLKFVLQCLMSSRAIINEMCLLLGYFGHDCKVVYHNLTCNVLILFGKHGKASQKAETM